jgi:hypothetical protein
MKKPLAALLLLVLITPLFAVFNGVQAETTVSGIISANTTWRQSQSPIKLTGPVAVPNGVTLTIEPGVTVDFGTYYMKVNGTLKAQGNENNKIQFKATVDSQNYLVQIQFGDCTTWNNQTGTGCILQNIIFDGTEISVEGSGAPVIANNIFYNQIGVIIAARISTATITGNIFQNIYYQGLSVGQSTTVTNNIFNKTTRTASAIIAHNNAYIANNVIVGCYNGICGDAKVTIKNNVVGNCSNYGIWAESTNVEVSKNYVFGNAMGIAGAGKVEYNTVTQNTVGIAADSPNSNLKPKIAYNNIADNKENLKVYSPGDIEVANNWWGTTNQQEITQSIHDYNDDFNLGTANIEPILSHPNTDAPSSSTIDQAIAAIDSGSFSFFDYQIEANILTVLEIVVAALAISWAIIAVIFVVKRFKK